MPTPMDALIGLVIASIGFLTLVIAFSLADAGKKKVSFVLAALITSLGMYHYVGAGMRARKIRKQFNYLQGQQQGNTAEIQKRLREQQAKKPQAPGTAVASAR